MPVVYDLDGFIQVARWEVAASRKQSTGAGMDQCYCPVLPGDPLLILKEEAYRLFAEREWEEALEEFTDLFTKQKDKINQAVYFHWMILCLYRLQRKHQATSKLNEWMEHNDHPYFAETDFLQALLNVETKTGLTQRIRLLGDATSYPEFIFKIKDQLSDFI